jgi:hypothetical protein
MIYGIASQNFIFMDGLDFTGNNPVRRGIEQLS